MAGGIRHGSASGLHQHRAQGLADAKKAAKARHDDYKFRILHSIPIVTKRFADVAVLAKAEMTKQLNTGVGKKSFVDYAIVIDRYLASQSR
ncbi:MAG: hypothetical protein WCY11_11020 [Novosphingobium sp.]